MSDFFGIGNAIKKLIDKYRYSSRFSGRTTNLINSVKTGDRVVFTKQNTADDFERQCKARDVEIECVAINPSRKDFPFGLHTVQGRTFFDHTWVEEAYTQAIDNVYNRINFYERELSKEHPDIKNFYIRRI